MDKFFEGGKKMRSDDVKNEEMQREGDGFSRDGEG